MKTIKAQFTPAMFTATEWSSADDKARFANKFVRFVLSGYDSKYFTYKFYNRLMKMFGHIAHYNLMGFWDIFFTSNQGIVRFAEITMRGGGYGDPRYTWSDVEQALKKWALEVKMLENAEKNLIDEAEKGERAELARLKEKYEGKIQALTN